MSDIMWENEEIEVQSLGIDVQPWIDWDITVGAVAAIIQGGCASGAYMPAVTYHQANNTMHDYGDDVLEFIEEAYGELPEPPPGTSWSGRSCHFLSIAVELWATGVEDEIIAELEDDE